MKIVAKCLAFVRLSYQVHVKVCNPIPLIELSTSNKKYLYMYLYQCTHEQFNE